jgi:DNA-binding MarR family transcriptional regulator
MEPIAPTDCFYYLVSRVTLVTTSVLKRELALCGAGTVTPAYLGVLMSLWNEDGLNVVELGRRAGLEPSTMTGLLDRMERDGIVVRQPHPDDRRAQRVSLTNEGTRLRQPVLDAVERTLGKATRGFSERQLATGRTFLRGFLANMQEERRGGDE